MNTKQTTKALYEVFKEVIEKYKKNNLEFWEIGESLVFNLNKDLMVFVSFFLFNPICYDIVFELKSRKKGSLDNFRINFSDLFKSISTSAVQPNTSVPISVSNPTSSIYPIYQTSQVHENILHSNGVYSSQNNQQMLLQLKYVFKNDNGIYMWSIKLTEDEKSALARELKTYINIWNNKKQI